MLKFIFVLTIFISAFAMAQSIVPESNPTTKPLISERFSAKEVNPPTYAAEITTEAKKDCLVQPQADANQADICLEGNKKFCPKGYTMKQKAKECPPSKMCAAVMIDYCERMPAR